MYQGDQYLYSIAYANQLCHDTWQGKPFFLKKELSLVNHVASMAITKPRYTSFNTSTPRYRESLYPSMAGLYFHLENVGDYSVGLGRVTHSYGVMDRTYMDEREGYMANGVPHMPNETKWRFRGVLE